MHKRKGPPGPPGRGAAAARQLGLLVDFSPDGLMIPEDGVNDKELEAEFLALVGGQPPALEKLKGKGPLPMETIEKMAGLCMRDLDEEEEGMDDDDVEADDELLAELNEVLGEDRKPLEPQPSSAQVPARRPCSPEPESHGQPEPKPLAPHPGLEATLQGRLALYQTAMESAKQAGDSAKMRRYDRGLKTLENLLASVRRGSAIDEEDIPPPVAVGKGPTAEPGRSPAPTQPAPTKPPSPEPRVTMEGPPPTAPASFPGGLAKPRLPLGPGSPSPLAQLQSRQREYKLAALHAKQQGDAATATRHFRVAKSLDAVLEVLSRGESVDLSRLPPPPDQLPADPASPPRPQPPTPTTAPSTPEVPPPPRTLLEALEQRMERYRMAAAQAKSKGDQRKARMHERIVKQYQDAIRAHKAGRAVDVAELPVPPGFPPIQGLEASEPAQQGLAGVLETAVKLATQTEGPEDEEDEEPKKQSHSPAAPTTQPKAPASRAPPSGSAPAAKAAPKGTSTRAQQQLTFLEGRKKQLLQAALRAKQKNDVEGAKMHLRQAKGLEPMLEASRNGLPVDITKVPPAPVNKDDFTLVQRPGPGLSQEAARRYGELTKLIRQQHEVCLNHSNQFTHLGNIAETSKFEKLAEDCKRSMETLKQAFARGLPTPQARFEQRTFSVIKIFPELSSNDLLLFIVKGINLPIPPGLSPGDLDVFVRFDFPYPNVEEAQKDKTGSVKNTDSPEFKEQFKLCINRGHRGFRRAIQTKGIKFEVVHKGGLFKTDRVLGTAQLKLDTLETACEVREILEVLDGRRPTGGRLEVMVRIREPLTAQQLETTTERWLVIDPVPAAMPPKQMTGPRGKAPPGPAPAREPGNRPARPLHSLSVLAFDQERLERKILALRQAQRPVPPEVAQQYQDVVQRSQWQRAQLEQGGAGVRREYATQLERQLQFYTEAARRLGNDGSREAAKEALYRRNLVENEVSRGGPAGRARHGLHLP